MKQKGQNKSNGNESLFAHIAFCADCGKGMTFRKTEEKWMAGLMYAYSILNTLHHTALLILSVLLLHAVKDDLRELIAANVKVDTERLTAKQMNSSQST